MSSRDNILNTVKNNQPPLRELPDLPGQRALGGDLPGERGPGADLSANLLLPFTTMVGAIGGSAYLVSGYGRIATILHEQHPDAKRIISGCPELAAFTASLGEAWVPGSDPHALENVDLAILRAHFGVAENGACWITEDRMIERVLPFITQHLALVLRRSEIVANMHEAYERIAMLEAAAPSDLAPSDPASSDLASSAPAAGTPVPGYGFATFIAGPSKTADIEQSLVLGAHGPRSLTVFLLDEEISDAGFY
jgi:L-lactate dehydrogenase complex protein LldG